MFSFSRKGAFFFRGELETIGKAREQEFSKLLQGEREIPTKLSFSRARLGEGIGGLAIVDRVPTGN